MVDGLTGDVGAQESFTNVELLAKDSLFILLKLLLIFASANPTDFYIQIK
jgi:hypothetical protein